MNELVCQAGRNDADRVTKKPPVPQETAGVDRIAVRAAVTLHPNLPFDALEVPFLVSVPPEPYPLALRAPSRLLPRILLPQLQQGLYIYGQMQ